MLQEFNEYLYSWVNRAMYIIGGQHTKITSEKDVDKYESGTNAIKAKKTYRRIAKETGTNVVWAFDCSGLGIYGLQLLGLIKSDMTAHGMMGKCKKVSDNHVNVGCWVFKVYTSGAKKGRAHHIGYVVGMKNNDPIIVSSRGRAYGVVTGETGWNAIGVPTYFETEISDIFVLRRVLKKGTKGEDVKYLQKTLNEKWNCGLEVDGIFGTKTQKAVKQIQRRFNIKDDGAVGRITATHMGIAYGGKL